MAPVSPPAVQAAIPHRVRHLLDVARRTFLAHGFEATSLEALARDAGVSKETVYRHFPDKEAVLRAAIVGLRDGFSGQAEAIASGAESPERKLVLHARAIHDSAAADGYLASVWLTVSVARAVPDLADRLLGDAIDRLEPLCRTLADIARARGSSTAPPLLLSADFGTLAVEGPRQLMGHPPRTPDARDRLAEAVAHLFARGIRCEPEPAPPPDCGDGDRTPGPTPPVPDHIAGLIDVGTRHFLDRGFLRASLDEIGAEARVGRGTLYRRFGSKAGLFAATMRAGADRMIPARLPPIPAGGDARDALVPFLEAASATLTSAASIALHRAVIAEARRDPALARDIHDRIRAPWLRPLTAWLDAAAIRGAVAPGDAGWRATQLLTLAAMGNRPLSDGRVPNAVDRAEAARRAVLIVMDGFAAAL